MLFRSSTKAIIGWFPPSQRATVVGLKQVGFPFGAMLGAAVLIAALGFWGFRAARQAADLRWAREEAIPEIERLLERDEQFAAWLLARRVEEQLGRWDLAEPEDRGAAPDEIVDDLAQAVEKRFELKDGSGGAGTTLRWSAKGRTIEVVAATVIVLSLIGLVAGLMPARRAANLNVVECLRT